MISRTLLGACLLLSLSQKSIAQQPDTSFHLAITTPAYRAGVGPVVCVDESHANRHTAGGTYAPFAGLLRSDGYRVQGLALPWSAGSLRECAVLVVANALAPPNTSDRSLPHIPAFSKAELDTVTAWINGGGGLLLIADHSPFAGAVADLGLILGVNMLDAFAAPGDSGAVIAVFGEPAVPDSMWRQYAADRGLPFRPIAGAIANPGLLGTHPIVRGRNPDERVRWLVTFTGQGFYPSSRVQPLLVFGPRAIATLDRRDAATFPIPGWLQGGAIEFGRGRAVILGEAAMCTAQIGGPRRVRTGMNIAEAPDNARFCLNVLHWLTRVADGP